MIISNYQELQEYKDESLAEFTILTVWLINWNIPKAFHKSVKITK